MKKYHYSLFILFLSVTMSGQHEGGSETSQMRLAFCQFPVSDQNIDKAGWIIKQYDKHFCIMDVDFIFQSFYKARQKPGGIHPEIIPVIARTRAATNYFSMSVCNSLSPSSWPCYFITPDGLCGGKLEGKLSSGKAHGHPGYSERKSI